MTPAQRRTLVAVARLLIAARVEDDAEIRAAALEMAIRLVVGLLKGKVEG